MRRISIFCIFILLVFIIPAFVFSDAIDVQITVNAFQCGDGVDNDGDSLIDYSDDPGCSSSSDDDEANYACGDGLDNDSDSLTDYPDDSGCGSATDNDEYNAPSGGGGGGGGGGGSSGGNAEVILTGRAYPQAKVFVLKDGRQVVQTIVGFDGKFSIKVSDLKEGSYNFSVFGEDTEGLKSSTFSFPVELDDATETEISGIFLPPTFSSNKKVVKSGDPIIFFGQAAPEANVIIKVNSETELFLREFSSSDGVYLVNFDSSRIEIGPHHATSRFEKVAEYSEFGAPLAFEVSNTNVYRDEEVSDFLRGDVNLDRRINLIDFSVSAFWYKKTLIGEMIQREIDVLNGDRQINLIDFSIMASNWTG